MTRVRAYIRESTVAQGDKFGPAAQRAAIAAACRELELPAPEREYVDLVSGAGKVVRDELRHAIAAAAAREYDVLVCYDTSRFARRERDAFAFEDQLQRAGVRIYYAAERIWADDDATALHKGVLHVINAEYSRALSRRIRDGLRAKKLKGGWVGGVPWGYRYGADRMALEPTPDAAVRLEAWALYATGAYTMRTLALELNRRGHRIRARAGDRPFTKWTVTEFFRSRVDLEHGRLDAATHARARAVLARRQTTAEGRGIRRHRYLFSMLVRCAECREPFWGRIQHDRAKGAPRAQLIHAPRGCARGVHYETTLERHFAEWLATWRLPAGARTKIARFLRRGRADDGRRARRQQLEGELERLRNLYRWGELAEREFLAQRSAVQDAIAALGADVVARPPSAEAIALAARIGEAWTRWSPESRRRFLVETFTEILIHRDGTVEVVPREAVRGLVYASLGAALADGTPAQPTRPTPIVVAGYGDWLAFLASEASA